MTVLALTPTIWQAATGSVWDLLVQVLDADDQAVAEVPVVTVTLPDNTTDTPTVDTVQTGVYRVEVVLATAGRYLATAVSTAYGSVALVAYATEPVAAAGMPALLDLVGDRATTFGYLGKTSWSDDEVQDALDAEAQSQRDVCRVPAEYPASLRQALLRRVARNLALRKLPLAVLRGDAEGGDTILPGRDPEVRRFEAPWRKLIMG